MLSFDGTDMEIVEIANEVQHIANSCNKNVFIIIDNDTLTVAIPNTTDRNVLVAQLMALRNEEESGE